jgi:hypothetical protein
VALLICLLNHLLKRVFYYRGLSNLSRALMPACGDHSSIKRRNRLLVTLSKTSQIQYSTKNLFNFSDSLKLVSIHLYLKRLIS